MQPDCFMVALNYRSDLTKNQHAQKLLGATRFLKGCVPSAPENRALAGGSHGETLVVLCTLPGGSACSGWYARQHQHLHHYLDQSPFQTGRYSCWGLLRV